jgi:hypothetical protein
MMIKVVMMMVMMMMGVILAVLVLHRACSCPSRTGRGGL